MGVVPECLLLEALILWPCACGVKGAPVDHVSKPFPLVILETTLTAY